MDIEKKYETNDELINYYTKNISYFLHTDDEEEEEEEDDEQE